MCAACTSVYTSVYIHVHVQYTSSIRTEWIVPISPCIQPHPDGVGSCVLPAIMPPCHLPVCTSASICKVSEYSLAHTARTDPSPCCDKEWLFLTVQHLQLRVLRPSIGMYSTVLRSYIHDLPARAAAKYRLFLQKKEGEDDPNAEIGAPPKMLA